MNHGSSRSSATTAIALLAGLAVSLTGLSGCDRESSESKNIRSAAEKMDNLTGQGAASPTPVRAASDYPAVAASLAGSGKAAAPIIIAQSQLGLADVAIGEGRDKERRAVELIGAVAPDLAFYTDRSAIAAVAEAFNPADDLAEISKLRSEKKTQAEAQRTQRAEVEKRVGDLRTQAKAKHTAAAAKQEEYSRLIQPTPSMTAVASAPIVERANAIRRQADALRLEGSRFDAQAEEIAPQLNELQLQIDQLVNQSKSLDERETDLISRQAANRTAAADARRTAQDAAKRVDDAAVEIAQLRTKDLEDAYAKALKFLKSALASAKEAGTGSPATSKITTGAAEQAIGQVHWERSRGLAAYAAFLDRLASAKPALPKAAEYKTNSEAAAAAAKTAREEAQAALTRAGQAYGSVQGVSGATKDKLKALEEQLKEAAKENANAAADSAATAATEKPAAATKPEAKPAETAAIDQELAKLLDGFVAATRDGKQSATLAFVHFPNPETKQAITDLVSKMEKLDAACKTKFGKTFTEAAAAMGGGMGGGMMAGLDPEKLKALKTSDLKTTVAGDSATIEIPGAPDPMIVKKFDGKWLIDMPQLAMMGTMSAPLIKGLDGVIADVESGKIAEIGGVMTAIMQAMMPKGGPGGG